MKNAISTATAITILFATSSLAPAATLTTTTADARVRFDGQLSTTGTSIEVGSHGSNYATSQFRSVYIMPFLLPTLGVGETIGNASLSFSVDTIDNMPNDQNADLYGLARVDGADTAVAGDFFEGALDGSNILLQDSILTSLSSVGLNSTNTSGGIALTSFLNTQYNGGANAGNYVFLRISSDVLPSGGNQRYKIATADNTTSQAIATINYSVVPEPGSTLLGLLGTGFFFLRRRR